MNTRLAPVKRGTTMAFRVVSCLVLAYIMLRPVGHPEILYPALAVLAVTSAAAVVFGRRWVSNEVGIVLGLVLLAALVAAFIGSSNPGMSQHIVVWAVGPLIFGGWALAADEKMLRAVLRTVMIATITLSMLIIVYVGSQLGLPAVVPTWLIEESGAGFNIEADATAIRLYGLSTLVAAAPLSIVAALVPTHPLLPPRSLSIVAAASATVAAVLGGRNALVVVVVIVPVGVLLWRLSKRLTDRIPVPAVVGALLAGLLLPFAIMWATADAAIQRSWAAVLAFFRGSAEQAERVEQAERLVDAWAQSPWFGHGLGAVIPGYARSDDRPWNFELQYHLMLFEFGVVGSAAVLVAVAVGVLGVSRAMRMRPDLAPVFVVLASGAIAMLIANATNPYLQAPGHMWAVWLPLMAANLALSSRREAGLDGATDSHRPRSQMVG